MELVDGPSLADVLAAEPVTPAYALDVLAKAASGLAAAHEAGVVHRDIKPGNILLGQDGQVKITDFGIAFALGSAPVTDPGLVMGTTQYLAPERIAGGSGTPAADLYSLGIVMHECLTGVPPYEGTPAEVMAGHLYVPLPPLPPGTPGEVEDLISRLCAKDPEQRLSDAGELTALARRVRKSVTGKPMPRPRQAAISGASSGPGASPVLGDPLLPGVGGLPRSDPFPGDPGFPEDPAFSGDSGFPEGSAFPEGSMFSEGPVFPEGPVLGSPVLGNPVPGDARPQRLAIGPGYGGPGYGGPGHGGPRHSGPSHRDPMNGGPAEPVVDSPVIGGSIYDDPGPDDPASEGPILTGAVVGGPRGDGPVLGDPFFGEHAYADDAYAGDAYADGAYRDEAYREDAYRDGVYEDATYYRSDAVPGGYAGPDGYAGYASRGRHSSPDGYRRPGRDGYAGPDGYPGPDGFAGPDRRPGRHAGPGPDGYTGQDSYTGPSTGDHSFPDGYSSGGRHSASGGFPAPGRHSSPDGYTSRDGYVYRDDHPDQDSYTGPSTGDHLLPGDYYADGYPDSYYTDGYAGPPVRDLPPWEIEEATGPGSPAAGLPAIPGTPGGTVDTGSPSGPGTALALRATTADRALAVPATRAIPGMVLDSDQVPPDGPGSHRRSRGGDEWYSGELPIGRRRHRRRAALSVGALVLVAGAGLGGAYALGALPGSPAANSSHSRAPLSEVQPNTSSPGAGSMAKSGQQAKPSPSKHATASPSATPSPSATQSATTAPPPATTGSGAGSSDSGSGSGGSGGGSKPKPSQPAQSPPSNCLLGVLCP
jgi:hypothetical protein